MNEQTEYKHISLAFFFLRTLDSILKVKSPLTDFNALTKKQKDELVVSLKERLFEVLDGVSENADYIELTGIPSIRGNFNKEFTLENLNNGTVIL